MYYYSFKIDSHLIRNNYSHLDSKSLQSNLSGVLVNTDWVLDYPRSYPPSFINVGGLQIRENPGELPLKMREFIDGAGTDGA